MMGDRQSRQGFLGPGAEQALESTVFGLVGLGGGGSHIVQQLSHVGALNFELFDPDVVEESNLNRLVGANAADATNAARKVDVAERLIRGLQHSAKIGSNPGPWQNHFRRLQRCHIVFGCLDSFAARAELERFARRYLIAYVDIGMDVVIGRDQTPVVGGQVVLSLPGGPCMRCMGFLTDELLAREAERYGDAGPRPQVVWMNGILASTAVGAAIDLLTGWAGIPDATKYYEFDGRFGTVKAISKFSGDGNCPHYSAHDVGDPIVRAI